MLVQVLAYSVVRICDYTLDSGCSVISQKVFFTVIVTKSTMQPKRKTLTFLLCVVTKKRAE